MGGSECIVLWGDEAGWIAAGLDTSALAERDPFWLTTDLADLIEDGAFLVLSPGGAWGIGQFFETPEGRELYATGVVAPNRGELMALIRTGKLIAVQTGCEIIRFGSARKGWQRAAKQIGFYERDDDEFVMKVA